MEGGNCLPNHGAPPTTHTQQTKRIVFKSNSHIYLRNIPTFVNSNMNKRYHQAELPSIVTLPSCKEKGEEEEKKKEKGKQQQQQQERLLPTLNCLVSSEDSLLSSASLSPWSLLFS